MVLNSTRITFRRFVSNLFVAALLFGSINAESETSRITLEIEGAGDPIFVIPGLSSSPDIFKNTVLSDLDGRVHWVTLAGFGGAPPPADLNSYTQPVADELAAYFEENNLQNVVLIGHSMGGVISLLTASQQTDRVDRILIIDSVPFLAGLMTPEVDPLQTAKGREAMRARFESMSDGQFMAAMQQGLPIQATSAESQAIVLADIARSDRHVIATAIAEIFTTDYRATLPRIESLVRVLVPHNQYSPGTPEQILSRYKSLYAGLDNLELRIVHDSRHFIMLDQPEAFAREVSIFLEEVINE